MANWDSHIWIFAAISMFVFVIWGGYAARTIYRVVRGRQRVGIVSGLMVGIFAAALIWAVVDVVSEHDKSFWSNIGGIEFEQFLPAVLVLAIIVFLARIGLRRRRASREISGMTRPLGAGTEGFRNPSNGYIEAISSPFLWTLLFGGIYFAVKGVWTHAVVGLLLAIPTGGISWLIYPFFARSIMERHYLRLGWEPVDSSWTSMPNDFEESKTCPECAEEIKAAAIVCRYCGHRFRVVGPSYNQS